MSTRSRGKEAEDAAVNYLVEHGYEILERNYYGGRCEIDIIARLKNIVAFIEVKSSNSEIPPETMVSDIKIQNLYRAAEIYLTGCQESDIDYRFDLIAMRRAGRLWRINHIEDAFRL
jgi:putative endonuclease